MRQSILPPASTGREEASSVVHRFRCVHLKLLHDVFVPTNKLNSGLQSSTICHRATYFAIASACPESLRPPRTFFGSSGTRPPSPQLVAQIDGYLRRFSPPFGRYHHEGKLLFYPIDKFIIQFVIYLQPITRDSEVSLLESVLLSDTQLWKAARSAWHRLFIAGLLMDPDAKRDFATVICVYNCIH